jgi:hypothetical protein
LGGDGSDTGRGIAVDSGGNVVVGGSTSSSNFPTANAYQASLASTFINDVFISKLNPSGSAFVYSTYLGGTGSDDCLSLAVDAAGNAYLTGTTSSADFPVVDAFQTTKSSLASDAYVAKLGPTGANLIYSSYLGGTDSDQGNSIAVDALGLGATQGPAIADFNGDNKLDIAVTSYNLGFVRIFYNNGSGGFGQSIADIPFDTQGQAPFLAAGAVGTRHQQHQKVRFRIHPHGRVCLVFHGTRGRKV